MKSTDHFKKTIKNFLLEKGRNDVPFQAKLKNPKKKLDDCITYILNQVKNSGCNGFTDDEIYSMAIHYYDEENIKPGDKISCNVVVNHQIELTPEEIEEQKQKAKQAVFSQEKERLTKKVKKETNNSDQEQTLF